MCHFLELYAFEPVPPGLEGDALRRFSLGACARRSQLLDELEAVFTFLAEHETLEGYDGMGMKHLDQIRDIKDAVESNCEGKALCVHFLDILKHYFSSQAK